LLPFVYNWCVMDNRPVGVFDSGLGGLTAVSVLQKIMPEENILYFGDTARCPYGKKSRDQIGSMTRDIIEYLMDFHPKALFAACGTISVNAGAVITSYGLPSVNVFDPAIEQIRQVEGTAPLAVIATEASIKTGVFQRGIQEACPGREVLAIPCQKFVTLCETGHISPEDEELIETVEGYLAPVREAKAAALILGCTHFGIIGRAISNYLGETTKLISASGSAAYAMQRVLKEKELLTSTPADGTFPSGSCRFFTSGDPAEFSELAGVILGHPVTAEHVDMPSVTA